MRSDGCVRAEPKTVTFRTSAVRGEHLERLRHLAERRPGELQVEPARVPPGELQHGLHDAAQDVAVVGRRRRVEEVLDERGDLGIRGAVRARGPRAPRGAHARTATRP